MIRNAVGRAFARAGLLGNPSDSYGGKTVAFSVRNFSARVSVEPADRLEIAEPLAESLAEPLAESLAEPLAGPLLTAALHRFFAHTGEPTVPLRMSVEVDVPFQVGLAGSSAIVIAALRALAAARGRVLDPFDQSELALAAEVDDLGVAAGPQDRAIGAYEGLLHMDFAGDRTPASYTGLDPALLPEMLIAWDPRGGESSNIVHSDVRERWQRGDAEIRSTMALFREIVDEGTQALRDGDLDRLRAAVDRNFDTRARLFQIADCDREMVAIARNQGAAAKQCGSGGACLAVPSNEADVDALAAAYEAAGYRTVRPEIVSSPFD